MALAFSKGSVFAVHTNAIDTGQFLIHVATSSDVTHRARALSETYEQVGLGAGCVNFTCIWLLSISVTNKRMAPVILVASFLPILNCTFSKEKRI